MKLTDSNTEKQLTNVSNIREDFLIEFFGYNFTALDIIKKLYVKVPFAKREYHDKNTVLDDDKLNRISYALDNKFLSSFHSNRYSLYDVSFREFGFSDSIGFNFLDLKDSTYINPDLVFKPFTEFKIDFISKSVEKIQKAMFFQRPQYNSISMIGLVVNDSNNLTCAKADIRFNREEAPTSIERINMIKRVISVINPQDLGVKCFSELAEKLENLGLVFAFVGVDCYVDGAERFKLYFKFHGENDLTEIAHEVASVLSRFGLHKNVQEVFDKHCNGMWGLAVSTESFETVNGVQLYFYP